MGPAFDSRLSQIFLSFCLSDIFLFADVLSDEFSVVRNVFISE